MKYLIILVLSLSFHFISSAVTANEPLKETITLPLWPKDAESDLSGTLRPDRGDNVIRITDISAPSMTVYPADNGHGTTPAVVIFPGGAYNYVVYNKEGSEIAQWLNTLGVTAIVVKYSVPDNRDKAHLDGVRAMQLVRHHAAAWNIDPENIGTIGVSAGGHLAARISTGFAHHSDNAIDNASDKIDELSSRPAFTILIYPGYLGNDNDTALADEIKVTTQTPPTFIVQTQDDTNLIAGTKLYDQALKKAGVSSVFHFFAEGGHGYGLRPSTYNVSNWPILCAAWMKASGILPAN